MCSIFVTVRSAFVKLSAALILIAFLTPLTALAQGDLSQEFRIEIGNNIPADLDQNISVPISVTAGSPELEGFDFLITYNKDALIFISASPGNLIAGGIYEYFVWQTLDPVGNNGYIRIVGVRDINDGSPNNNPSVSGPGELARLNFHVTTNPDYECIATPIRFIWLDCGDNSLSAKSSDTAVYIISDQVVDYWNFPYQIITDPLAEFPTIYGAPDECIDLTVPNPPFRFANYFDGCVTIKCQDINDDRGDVNLNGIDYELADFVTFLNYLIYGNSALTINVDGQISATDVYPDGVPSTLNDFIYFIRVLVGDALPYADSDFINPEIAFSGAVAQIPTDSSIIIRTQFEEPVGGLHFTFFSPDISSEEDYTITKFPPLEYINLVPFIKDDSLHILVYRDPYPPDTWSDPGTIDGNLADIFEIHSAGAAPQLIHVEASGYMGEPVNVVIAQLPNSPPVFNSYPAEVANNPDGTFYYDFNAADDDNPADWIRYHIVQGSGSIDSITGEYSFAAICGDVGPSMEIQICASDGINSCSQIDPSLYAVMSIELAYQPSDKGDINSDNSIDMIDIQYLVNYLYRGGAQPQVIESADINNDGKVDILDIIHLINYEFKAGPAPVCD